MPRQKPKRTRGGASVPCPVCSGPSHVIITRRVEDHVVRKRQCDRQRHPFTTSERVVADEPNPA